MLSSLTFTLVLGGEEDGFPRILVCESIPGKAIDPTVNRDPVKLGTVTTWVKVHSIL